jgi:DNA polymerase-1
MAQNRGKRVADSAQVGQATAPGAADGDLANSSRTTAAAGGPKPLLLLVDGHSLAFRSFYAFAKGGDGGLSTKAGVPTSVTYGFLKALLDNCRGLNPQGVVIAFDTAEPTFRHEADAAYKAHREEAPEHFFEDLGNLQRILAEALDLSLCLAPGYEADDVLGTLANRAANGGWRVRILSGDRDLFQLVDDQRDIAVLYMGGGPYAKNSGPVEIRREGVIAKLGVPPEDVVDLKALTGDSSDNIPGVKGVGPKTAINLLQENGSLEGIYAALDTLEGPKAAKGALKGAIREKLATERENAFRSRMLAEILLDIPLPSEPRLELGAVNSESLAGNLEELELFSLVRQVANFTRLFSAQPLSVTTDPGAGSDETTNQRHSASADGAAAAHATHPGAVALHTIGTPDAAAGPATATPSLQPELITTEAQLAALLFRLQAATDPAHPVALDTETTALNPFRAELVGIGLCWGAGASDLAYIPIGHGGSESQGLLAGLGEAAAEASITQLPLATVLQALAPRLASPPPPQTLQKAK